MAGMEWNGKRMAWDGMAGELEQWVGRCWGST
eukprot:CAMPEP_0206567340 /NCGR_PEP_ID=MMETSP0325_2-20121206/25178_1 /ASSEMBLY_ACC=CAM_ASM_000347 /TAXON_ID=2866 /ORGANISM="Crypthecodinium cohnii, Strain Seligo" /LENGTH=31 /DNA_ID= /DNA_START= /DNA_END= /DNA_ORIENTATION=